MTHDQLLVTIKKHKMVIRNILLRSRNNSFLKKLSNTKNFNIASSEQPTHSYPLLLNINRNHYSFSGLVLPRSNYQNHNLQKLLSSKVDVPAKNSEDIKEINSSCNKEDNKSSALVLTRKEKLKKALKQYGPIVIVFHVGISLISLGTCYLLVSSGLDVAKLIQAVGLEQWITKSEVAASAGTFAVAYAVHKVFAPVRITITLGSVPFIVRYLRRVGFLKK